MRISKQIILSQSLRQFIHWKENWWESIPARADWTIELSKNQQFWQLYGKYFGYAFDGVSPYEEAIEYRLTRRDYEFIIWFYLKSGMFSLPLEKHKLGAWCYGFSLVKRLQDGKNYLISVHKITSVQRRWFL